MIRLCIVDDKLSEADCAEIESRMGKALGGIARVKVAGPFSASTVGPCDVLFVHVNNDEWSDMPPRLSVLLEKLGPPHVVVLTTGGVTGATEEHVRRMRPSDGLRGRIRLFPRALTGKAGYLELSEPLRALLAEWKPGDDFPVGSLVAREGGAGGALLRPFAALDVLLQGYLAVHDPEAFREELEGLDPDAREAVVAAARRAREEGALDDPADWFRESWAGFEKDGAGGGGPSWHFLDRRGELWCFAGGGRAPGDGGASRERAEDYDSLLLEYADETSRGGASREADEVVGLLGSDELVRARGLERPDDGRALEEVCQALSTAARSGAAGAFAIARDELPEKARAARRALARVRSLLKG